MSKKIDLILADALVGNGLVVREQMDALMQESGGSGDGLQAVLLKRGVLAEKDILIVLAGKLRIPYVQLKELAVEKSVLDKISVKIASYYGFVPLNISGRILTIAVSSVPDIRIKDEIRIQLGYEIEIALTEQNDIADVLEKWRGRGVDFVRETVVPPLEKVVALAPEGSLPPGGPLPKGAYQPQAKFSMTTRRLLGEILIKKGLLTPERLALALGEQVITKELLGTIVVRKGWVQEKDLLAALSERFNMPLVDLKNRQIDWSITAEFSSSLIFDYRCVPFKRDDRSVTMAINNPLDAWTIKRAEEEAKGLILELALTSREDIDDAVKRYQRYIQKGTP